MGLDMYLEAEQYISDYNERDEPLIKAIQENIDSGLEEFRPKNIRFELAYWRKANAIHAWFVNNVQEGKDECQSSYVSLEDLETLREVCAKVLANKELAAELLPTAKGFFFGDTSYNEYYFEDVKRTLQKLDKILSNPNAKSWWITYTASW
jgi:hypothetical protein